VLGILALAALPLVCCCGVGPVVAIPLGAGAVVFGFMARNRIVSSRGAFGGDGKALAGIVTGGTALAIAIVLVVVYLFLGGFHFPPVSTPRG
jgi:hypothetical protein